MTVSLLEVLNASKLGLSPLKNLVTSSLATTGRSNNHETVSNISGVKQLEHLVDKWINSLDMEVFTLILDSVEQDTSVNDWVLNTWEKI